MSFNYTVDSLPPLPAYELKSQPSLLPWISDVNLALASPIIVYWLVSLFFHLIDTYDVWPQYRLHTPEELLMRNHASRWEVFRDVVIQQVIETIAGLTVAYFEPETMCGKEGYDVAVWARRIRIAEKTIPSLLGCLGINALALSKDWQMTSPVLAGVMSGGKYPLKSTVVDGEFALAPTFASWEIWAAKAIYYAVIPGLQLVGASIVMDTWQYFWHRAMHLNKWMYTAWHSRHHRLYVPYAYGALYNHPIEGFILDTVGTGVAYACMGLTARQSIIFFSLAAAKTVDDHCGYKLPWDPLQQISGNNAAYHDIHHQSFGIKTNFSQPWFTFWDSFMGTMWSGEIKTKYERQAKAAEAKWLASQKGVVDPAVQAVGSLQEKEN